MGDFEKSPFPGKNIKKEENNIFFFLSLGYGQKGFRYEV